MRKTIASIMLALFTVSAFCQNYYDNIVSPQAGSLKKLAPLSDWKQVTNIAIIGPINEEDIMFLGWLTIHGKIKHLSLYEATGIKYIPKKCFSIYGQKDSTKGSEKDESKLETFKMSQMMTEIRDSAFAECKNLRLFTANDSLRTIGDFCFFNCRKMEEFALSKTLTDIGEFAFLDCKNILKVEFPKKVTRIRRGAFMGCDTLGLIKLSDETREIEELAFNGCKLDIVICPCMTPPAISMNSMKSMPESGGLLRIKPGTKERYRRAPVWQFFEIYEDRFMK